MWNDEFLDKTLVQLTEQDSFTVRDSFEGTMVWGGTGSGKTSGSGNAFARAFVESGFGGLVLTAKNDELEFWRQITREYGREKQLVIIKPTNPYFFNWLEYEAKRQDGSDTQTVESLLILIIEVANEGSIQSSDSYWLLALRQMIRNTIDMLKCAGEVVSVENMYRFIVTAPTSISRLKSSDWQKDSYAYHCLTKATENYERWLDENQR